MVGGELPGWMAARGDGTVAASSDLEVVRQTLCADIDAERFAKEVYPRYVLASLSSAATPSTAPLPQHPTTYIICEQDQASRKPRKRCLPPPTTSSGCRPHTRPSCPCPSSWQEPSAAPSAQPDPDMRGEHDRRATSVQLTRVFGGQQR
jgi:hypothetical protein